MSQCYCSVIAECCSVFQFVLVCFGLFQCVPVCTRVNNYHVYTSKKSQAIQKSFKSEVS